MFCIRKGWSDLECDLGWDLWQYGSQQAATQQYGGMERIISRAPFFFFFFSVL